MSCNDLILLPDQPRVKPEAQRAEQALALVRALFPRASGVHIRETEPLEFIDAGANSGSIHCPSCQSRLDTAWWADAMQDRFDQGFTTLEVHLPCCGQKHSLNDLVYEWPQGFARWSITIRSPARDSLSTEERRRFEEVLGIPVRVVWRRV